MATVMAMAMAMESLHHRRRKHSQPLYKTACTNYASKQPSTRRVTPRYTCSTRSKPKRWKSAASRNN
jgi:hypothetical protein